MVTIVTGEQGIGKTSFLLHYLKTYTSPDTSGGILTPAVTDASGQIKTGFDALDISTGRRWPLGRTTKNLGGPEFGPFSFSAEGFSRAADTFKAALSRKDSFLFLDEIGPLELEKKAGFYTLLPLLSRIPEPCRLCVVIRPSLIEKAVTEIFHNAECRIVEITRLNRDSKNIHLF